ncbi:MAG: hypothetical protein WDM96_08775 [Lacunisphaera sp.]
MNAYVVKPLKFHEFIEAIKVLGAFWVVLNEPVPGDSAPAPFPAMKILHLEDNPRDAMLVRDLLTQECAGLLHQRRRHARTTIPLAAPARRLRPDSCRTTSSRGFNGLDALDLVREFAPEIPFVFFSGTLGEEERDSDAVRSGAGRLRRQGSHATPADVRPARAARSDGAPPPAPGGGGAGPRSSTCCSS